MEYLLVGGAVGAVVTLYRIFTTPSAKPARFVVSVLIAAALMAAIASVGLFTQLQPSPEPPAAGPVSPPDSAMFTLLTTPTVQGFLIAGFYFVIMLAGMGAEYMFGLRHATEFKLFDFVKPFWVALIVFGIPWSIVDKQYVNYASILACYQNGFFWKKILEKQTPS